MKAGVVTLYSENRKNYLAPYLHHTLPYLDDNLGKIGVDYEFIISEQTNNSDPYNFNLNFNVGFLYAFEELNCDYAILVPPDQIPVSNVDYKWKGYNERCFTMYGGYKLDKESFYKSHGGNNFMLGWGWQDIEYYDRLKFYDIFSTKWYTTKEGINSAIIDLEYDTRDYVELSTSKWGQGRPVTLDQVPTIYNSTDLPEYNLDVTPYERTGWCEHMLLDGNKLIAALIKDLDKKARNRYYEISGYKRVDMERVEKCTITHPHTNEPTIHNVKYNSYHVYNRDLDPNRNLV